MLPHRSRITARKSCGFRAPLRPVIDQQDPDDNDNENENDDDDEQSDCSEESGGTVFDDEIKDEPIDEEDEEEEGVYNDYWPPGFHAEGIHLPSRLSRPAKYTGFRFWEDHRQVEKLPSSADTRHFPRIGVVRSSTPIPSEVPYFYFELTILRLAKDNSSEVSIGLGEQHSSLKAMPGTVFDSYGFCNGKVFGGAAGLEGAEYGNSTMEFKVGDSVGCCLVQCGRDGAKEIFFTINGRWNRVMAIRDVPDYPLFPIIGMKGAGMIRWNFGHQAFVFKDLKENMMDLHPLLRTQPFTPHPSNHLTHLNPSAIDKRNSWIQHHVPHLPIPLGCWNPKDCRRLLTISEDACRVSYDDIPQEYPAEAASIRFTQPIPRDGPVGLILYIELELLSDLPDPVIALGYCLASDSLSELPGKAVDSAGANISTGFYYGGDGRSHPLDNFNAPMRKGSVLGTGVHRILKRNGGGLEYFFTVNGKYAGTLYEKNPKPLTYPMLGISTPGFSVLTNYGQKPFRFDLQMYLLCISPGTRTKQQRAQINEAMGHNMWRGGEKVVTNRSKAASGVKQSNSAFSTPNKSSNRLQSSTGSSSSMNSSNRPSTSAPSAVKRKLINENPLSIPSTSTLSFHSSITSPNRTSTPASSALKRKLIDATPSFDHPSASTLSRQSNTPPTQPLPVDGQQRTDGKKDIVKLLIDEKFRAALATIKECFPELLCRPANAELHFSLKLAEFREAIREMRSKEPASEADSHRMLMVGQELSTLSTSLPASSPLIRKMNAARSMIFDTNTPVETENELELVAKFLQAFTD